MSDKNPALKGIKGGNCNRTACQKPGARYFNKSTRAYYCRECAEAINDAARIHDREPLCKLDEAT